MIANNPGGVLNPLITSTTVALASLDATLTNETGKLGTQKAMTQAKQTFRAALRVLKLQLFKNLLELAGLFPNDEEKAMLYCPQQYLEDPQQPTPPPVPPTP